MRNIRMEKDIILYYNNPAGYVSGGKAVVDPLFESEELNAFLSRQKARYSRTHAAEKLPGMAAKARIRSPDALHQPCEFL